MVASTMQTHTNTVVLHLWIHPAALRSSVLASPLSGVYGSWNGDLAACVCQAACFFSDSSYGWSCDGRGYKVAVACCSGDEESEDEAEAWRDEPTPLSVSEVGIATYPDCDDTIVLFFAAMLLREVVQQGASSMVVGGGELCTGWGCRPEEGERSTIGQKGTTGSGSSDNSPVFQSRRGTGTGTGYPLSVHAHTQPPLLSHHQKGKDNP